MAEKFVLATHNPGKLREMSDILSKFGIQVVSPADVGITVDVEETGTTFAENAMLKAKAICEASGLPAIADDSGLCVDALNGGPGVYSARYGGEELDDRGRYMLLLNSMRGQTTRAAHFACAIACATWLRHALCVHTNATVGRFMNLLLSPDGLHYIDYCRYNYIDRCRYIKEDNNDDRDTIRVGARGVFVVGGQ